MGVEGRGSRGGKGREGDGWGVVGRGGESMTAVLLKMKFSGIRV
jgi:hypothetical protein